MKILVAEDDADSREFLVALLTGSGYEVESFENGLKAYAALQVSPVDLIISDILMPEMDGYGLCKAVKQHINLQKIPFIFYTATYTTRKDEQFALALGANKFLIKPMPVQDLLNVITEVMRAPVGSKLNKGRGLYRASPIKIDKQHTERVREKLDKKILELNQERQKLLENETRIRDFAEASADWFWETDPDLNIAMVAGSQADFNYQNLNDLRDAYYGHQGDVHTTILKHQKFSDYIVQSCDKQGKTTYLRISGKPIFDEHGMFSGYRGSGRDVSEVIALSRRVEHLASHDDLTGLPNRVLFRQRLEHAILKADRVGQQVLLLFFDLDYFKMINDTLGHDAGDQLLLQAANRIRENIRSSDVLCRLGGDEFVMIMEHASPQDGHRLVREIINAFANPFEIRGQTFYNTMSIGVSVYPDDTSDPETLLLYADLAMYRAKQNGRNDFEFYTSDLNYIAHQWLEMEHGLRQALKQQQLFMLYQPQIDIESNTLMGLEALLRWKHPERGLIPPLEFIKIAEQSSLINEIGDFVLSAVCQQLRVWIDSGKTPSRINVNISARHLRSANFRKMLARYLEEYQIPNHLLGIEITEHALLENTDEVKKNMLYIKDAGLYIALDDFGTGHSSLLYLKRWSVDAVKIDQSFVTGLASNQEDRAIVKAIIALSEALDLDLVGEGVESQQQSDILIEGGCKVMQGLFYSPPLPPAEVQEWFDR